MKKINLKASFLLFMLGASTFSLLSSVTAESANTFEANPSNFVILQNDLGNKSPITIKNITNKELKLTAEECLASKDAGSIKLSDTKVSKSLISIDTPIFVIKANSESTLITRVKISASGGDALTPCILIKSQDKTDTTSVLIPYLIQNFSGEQKFDLILDIGKTGIVSDASLTIKGSIANTGNKFFDPAGKVIISKDGAALSEIDITPQIKSLMLPGDTRTFEVKWTNTLQGFSSIGDYKVELKITTEESTRTSVKQIIFTYIPSDYILLGFIIAGAIVLIIIGVVIFKKKQT